MLLPCRRVAPFLHLRSTLAITLCLCTKAISVRALHFTEIRRRFDNNRLCECLCCVCVQVKQSKCISTTTIPSFSLILDSPLVSCVVQSFHWRRRHVTTYSFLLRFIVFRKFIVLLCCIVAYTYYASPRKPNLKRKFCLLINKVANMSIIK